MIAVLALAVAGGAAHAAGSERARPVVRTHHDAPPGVAHLRAGLRELLGIHGPRISAGVRVGRSAGGRPIVATASGNPAAAERALVVGCIHGTECAGMAVARRVLRGPAGTAPHWQNTTAFPGTASFVVELPPGPLSAAAARRHAHTIQVLSGVA